MVNVIGPYRSIVKIECQHDEPPENPRPPSDDWTSFELYWNDDGSVYRVVNGGGSWLTNRWVQGLVEHGDGVRAPTDERFDILAQFRMVGDAAMFYDANPDATLDWNISFSGPGAELSYSGHLGSHGLDSYDSGFGSEVRLSGGEEYRAENDIVLDTGSGVILNENAGAHVIIRWKYVQKL